MFFFQAAVLLLNAIPERKFEPSSRYEGQYLDCGELGAVILLLLFIILLFFLFLQRSLGAAQSKAAQSP